MYYDSSIYENFRELSSAHPDIAEHLQSDVSDGEWKNSDLYFYPTPEDFAIYEVIDGWYASSSLDADFNGAPNLIDYLDFDSLAEALISSWDDSCYWTDGDVVVQTTYGW